ncbi:MAG: DUF1573 domain-containing protein [Chitinophagales bacterium]|nr:DUF1573 domain-containing protein [Chitinophagales bacterium]
MKYFVICLFSLALTWVSCQSDANVSQDQKGGPNSELIRNPASANFPTDTNQLARIVFDEKEFYFGTVNEGDEVNHVFRFTNTGKIPLTILNCKSSCGCTVPEWPEEPIPPGGTGEIKAKFDTSGKGKDGETKKMITVTANTYPNQTKITLKGIINPVKG